MGLEEIPSESITSNGYLNDIPVKSLTLAHASAKDGLRLNYNNSKLLQSVFKGGDLFTN